MILEGSVVGVYDFALQGGGVGSINLFGNCLPDNAVITHAAYKIVEPFTSLGGAVVALGHGDSAECIHALAAFNHADYASGNHDGVPDGTATNF